MLVTIFCGSAAVPAQSAAEPKRFLFVIDTSASMKPFENAVRESMFDLIYSGVRGQMTNGDTYGIWLVSEQNDTSFKMETWKKQHIVEMAARAAIHVKDRGFKGKANLSQALADAADVIKNVEDLKVILISNGETPIGGTPFDDVINVRFRELAPLMKRAKNTLNTALVAQDGKIIAWAANTPDFLIEVPIVPPKRKPIRPKVAASQTNAPATVVTSAPVAANIIETPKPRVATTPIIITKETVAQEKRTYQAMTSTASGETLASTNLTNAVVKAEPSVATNAVAGAATTNVAATNTIATGPNTSIKGTVPGVPAIATSAVDQSEPTNIVAAVPPESPSNPMKTEVVHLAVTWPAALWATIGASMALALVLGVFLISRTKRQQPSLISESLARERIQPG